MSKNSPLFVFYFVINYLLVSVEPVFSAVTIVTSAMKEILTSSYLSIYSVLRLVSPFQNNVKVLDPSCKTDLDFCDCFGKENSISYPNYLRLIDIYAIILKRFAPIL